MMDVIGRFAPEQHVYSIDESFLSFQRAYPAISDLRIHGQTIRRAVWKECRLPVCVGMGETLTLAKIANHAAKKIPGYNGVCVIDNERERLDVLGQLSVGDVWGIGRKLEKRFQQMGIHTALKLAQYPVGLVKKNFNVEVERTIRELNGQVCKKWDQVRADKQQIYSTRSVGERIVDIESLRQALSKHAGIAARKARQQGSLCKVFLCFAGNSPFDEHPQSFRFLHRFAYPTADTQQLTKVACDAAEQLFKEGVRYYKIGVGLLDLSDGTHEQFDLLNPIPNNTKLMSVFDQINGKYGSDTMFMAAQGIDEKWGMRRELLTPQYTTRWRDLPLLKCN